MGWEHFRFKVLPKPLINWVQVSKEADKKLLLRARLYSAPRG
jgi:hypothetical protein